MTEKPEILATARSTSYQFSSIALGYLDAAQLCRLKGMLPRLEASLVVLRDQECLTAIKTLQSILKPLTFEDWHRMYLHFFGHTISKDCPPYETEYGQSHIFRKSQKLADIAGFYKAFGVELSPELNDRWDHISVELEFMQLLCLKEAYALAQDHAEEKITLCRDAQVAFLEEHLGCWVLGFARRMGKKTGDTFYGSISKLLESFLIAELHRFDVQPETEMPPLLEEDFEEAAAGCQDCTLANSMAALEQGEMQ